MKIPYTRHSVIRLFFVLLMITGLPVGGNRAFALNGSGSASDPFRIGSTADWNSFVSMLNQGNTLENKYVALTADVEMNSTYAQSRYFSGTFDGKGHTLSIAMSSNYAEYVSPFREVRDATIKNLKVVGYINDHAGCRYMGGLVGNCMGTTTISNCQVSVEINSYSNGDGSHGGIIGLMSCTSSTSHTNVQITDCLFNGKLMGSNTSSCGGFIGAANYGDADRISSSISSSVFAPEQITINITGCATFSRATTTTITNCYYSKSFGSAQGTYAAKNGNSIIDIIMDLGEEWIIAFDITNENRLSNSYKYYYLKTFSKNTSLGDIPYVDIDGWFKGQTISQPFKVQGNNSRTNYNYKYKSGDSWVNSSTPSSSSPSGLYRVIGCYDDWYSCREFPVVVPPTVNNLTYNGSPQVLLSAPDTPTADATYYYKLSSSDNWSVTIPSATAAADDVPVDGKATFNNGNRHYPFNDVYGTFHGKIKRKDVASPTITLNSTSMVYTGSGLEPGVTVKDGDDVIPQEEYTVAYANNVNVGTATVTVSDKDAGNYVLPAITGMNFDITKSSLTVSGLQARTLIYNTEPQELVTAGTIVGPPPLDGCAIKYCSDGVNYSAGIPTGNQVGDYTVYYRVDGDANHEGLDPVMITVTINPKKLTNPTIILNPSSFTYDGTTKEPTVTVKDGDTLIPSSEYTVSYTDNKDVGTAKVTITDKEGGNYDVSGSASFSIVAADAGFTPPTVKTGLVYNGAEQELLIAGTATGGTMQYSPDGKTFSTTIPVGTDALQYTVYYQVVGDDNHEGRAPTALTVTISPKTVMSPVIELSPTSYKYDGNPKNPAVTVRDGTTVIPVWEYTVSYTDNTNIGTATAVVTDNPGGNYTVSGTASFTIIDPETGIVSPTSIPGLVYTRSAQTLVTAGIAPEGLTMMYSLDNQNYASALPVGTDAKEYTVYYKVVDKDNKDQSKVGSLKVKISPKTVKISATVVDNGPNRMPSLTVVDEEGTELTENDYSITFRNSEGQVVTPSSSVLRAGDYAVTIKPVGNYTGQSITKTITIKSSFSFVFTMVSDQITICLPFDREVPSGYHVYYFDRLDDRGLPIFKRILTSVLRAGQPYLLRYVGSSSTRGTRTLDLTPSNPALVDITTTIKVEYIDDMMFMGTFDDVSSYKAHADGAYILQADNTWTVPADNGSTVSLEAFHAYLRYMDRSTPFDTMTITLKATTDIDEIDPTALNQVILDEGDDGHWYDLQGRRIDGPQRGVNIIRKSDGTIRKVIKK